MRDAGFFFPYVRPLLGMIIAGIFAGLLANLLRLPVVYLPMVLTRHFQVPHWFLRERLEPIFGSPAYLYYVVGGALLCMLLSALVMLLVGYLTVRVGERLLRSIRAAVFNQIEQLSMQAIYAKGAGEFVQRLTRDLYYIRDLYNNTFSQIITAFLQMLVFVTAMLWMRPLLTLGLLAIFSLTAPVIRLVNRRVERLARRMQQIAEAILSHLVESIGGYRDLRASGRFDRMASRFDQHLAEAESASIRTTMWAQTGGVLVQMAISTMIVLPYFALMGQLQSAADVGSLLTYVGLLSQTMPVFTAVTRSTSELALASPSLRAVRAILEERDEARQHVAPPEAPEPHAHAPVSARGPEPPELGPIEAIRFEHVGLNLGGRWVLEDLNFEIAGGKTTAIIGQSGAGKTTIFHLLLRLIEPNRGTIWVNDVPLARLDEKLLRRTVGFIPQNPFIFNQSLRENLLVAVPSGRDESDTALMLAVELAQLDPLIESRRAQGGLDASAGYMGMGLSAGERQRVALARLLLQDPQVIVCDEYTANIDVKTARLIQDMMNTRLAERTRVVITHELFTIKGADHIVVLDAGRAVQQGRHESLLEQPGLYKVLWETQRLE